MRAQASRLPARPGAAPPPAARAPRPGCDRQHAVLVAHHDVAGVHHHAPHAHRHVDLARAGLVGAAMRHAAGIHGEVARADASRRRGWRRRSPGPAAPRLSAKRGHDLADQRLARARRRRRPPARRRAGRSRRRGGSPGCRRRGCARSPRCRPSGAAGGRASSPTVPDEPRHVVAEQGGSQLAQRRQQRRVGRRGRTACWRQPGGFMRTRALLAEVGGQAGVDRGGRCPRRSGPVLGIQPGDRVDVSLGVVEMVAGLGIDALHRADRLGREQDVVGPGSPWPAARCRAGGRRRCRRTRCAAGARAAAACFMSCARPR